MEKASVEPRQRFTDATCDDLLGLVLAQATLAPGEPAPKWLLERWRQLQQRDLALAAWVRNFSAGRTETECLAALIMQLSQAGHWIAGASPSPAARRLLDAVGMAARLHCLEQRFSEELDAQKQQAIYNFAYGLSHELNNPLANIATRAGVLERDEPKPHRAGVLRAIVEHAMRGCEMLGDLMLVARPPQLNKRRMQVRDLLQSVADQGQAWAKQRGVELDLQHGEAVELLVDPASLREALWAILRNAIEAMPEGGVIHMRSRRVVREAGQGVQNGLLSRPPSYPGDEAPEDARSADSYCCIDILDSGSGFTPHALQNCLDPYFSGREAGRGLGLGLSKAERIVRLHAGRMLVANRPGGGASVTIKLPVG